MRSLEFASPRALWLLALIPLLIGWLVYARRRRAVVRFSASSLLGAGGVVGLRARTLWVLPALSLLALATAIVALARPQERDARQTDLSIEGIDIVLALDLSTSMEAADLKPKNRITAAKEVLNDFISKRDNDRVGLVVFAGEAFTQSPLTFDHEAVKELVRQLKTRVLKDGTAIGDALAAALNRLRDSDAKSRVVVLITDGDNNAGAISPLDAANAAKTLGIPIFTILVGQEKSRVPFQIGTDMFGQPVFRDVEIPVNPDLLKTIAAKTGGEFYRATDTESLKQGLQKVLDSLTRSKLLEGGAVATYREKYHPWLLAAFLLLGLELLLRTTVYRVSP